MKELQVRDKGKRNISVYKLVGCGLDLEIKNDYENLKGIITGWSLNIYNEKMYNCDSFDKLLKVLRQLVIDYNLTQYSVNKKDILVIYIDNLDKIRGFFEDYITNDFTHYVQIFNCIEFRDISTWNKELHRANEIAEYAQFLIEYLFEPEKYFYLTPNQQVRRKISKRVKNEQDNVAARLFPDSYEYDYIRSCLYGGLCYCPKPFEKIEEPIIEIDLDSAYIWSFLTQQHCMSLLYRVDSTKWKEYLDSDKGSFGRYYLKFFGNTLKLSWLKDMYGVEYMHNEINEGYYMLTNVDLKIIISLTDKIEVKCKSLYEVDLDYLPEYVRDVLIEEYVKKEELKQTLGSNNPKTKIQKVRVNGIYGDSIRRYDDTFDIKRAKDTAVLIPQWGIFTTGYTKSILIGLGLQLDGWYYSDTDSIYCKDTPKNRKIIEEYNKIIREETKSFCDRFGYDYDKLSKLGTFEIKNEITIFRAIGNKMYAYKRKNGEIKLVAAGSSQDTVKIDDSIFDLYKIPIGTRVFGFINDKSYFEIVLKDEDAELMQEYLIKRKALEEMQKKKQK